MGFGLEIVILATIGGVGYLIYHLNKLNSDKEEEYSEEGYIVMGYPDRYTSTEYENEEE